MSAKQTMAIRPEEVPALPKMEEDIDIEEHDVMDNPTVKSVFPDLSIVKNEILDYNIEDSLPQGSQKKAKTVTADSTTDITLSPLVPKTEFPEVSSTQVESENRPNLSPVTTDPKRKTDENFINNRIILGTKRTPNEELKRSLEITRKYREMDKCLSVKLVLKDCGIRLWKSKTYCSECKTLFPTLNDIDVHRAEMHTAVVKDEVPEVEAIATLSGVKKYECHLCEITVNRMYNLRQHYKKSHNIDMPLGQIIAKEVPMSTLNQEVVHDSVSKYITSSLNQTVVRDSVKKYIAARDSSKVLLTSVPDKTAEEKLQCSHCSDSFYNKEALISHLYQVLNPKAPNDPPAERKVDANKKPKRKQENDQQKSEAVDKVEDAVEVASKRVKKISESPPEAEDTFIICELCSCYFKLKWRFDAHIKDRHNTLCYGDVGYGYGAFDMKCAFCGLASCNTKLYNKHVIDGHSDSYRSYAKIRRTNKLFVPKSVLFRCIKCEMHFTSYSVASVHWCRDSVILKTPKCDVCCRVINSFCVQTHEAQHRLGDDFNVIPVGSYSDMLAKILNNCPKCGVHFNDKSFAKHFCRCGNKAPDSYYCKVCDILIDKSISSAHEASHKTIKINDFIIIHYEVTEEDKPKEIQTVNTKGKRPIDSEYEQVEPKKVRVDTGEDFDSRDASDDNDHYSGVEIQEGADSEIEEVESKLDDPNLETAEGTDGGTNSESLRDLNLIYCHTCNFCICMDSEWKEFHIQKICLEKSNKEILCHECNIKMSNREIQQHREMHKMNKTLLDFKFYDFDYKRIKPPFPLLKFCATCKINCKFTEHWNCLKYKKGERSHCVRCKSDFSKATYSVHEMYHKYHDIFDKTIKNDEAAYVLHQCRKCDVIVSSDNLEAHENVKYDCDLVKDLYKKCQDCGYSIVGKYFNEHKKQHDSNPQFRKETIKIVYFGEAKDKKTETEKDDEDFDTFSDDGNSHCKYTFYQCRNCDCCVATSYITKNHKCPALTCRTPCVICGLKFYSAGLAKHYQTHKIQSDLTRENIRIVQYDPPNGIKGPRKIRSDKKVRDNTLKPKHKPHYEKLQIEELTPSVMPNRMYQCRICKLNYYDNVVNTHVCVKKIPYRCIICKLTFDKLVYEKHLAFHSADKAYDRSCINIVVFSKTAEMASQNKPTPDPVITNTETVTATNVDEEIETIYKCPCGLHFFSKSGAIDHLKSCGKVKISKQNCTKCKLLFTPEVLFSHLVTHHGNKNKLFKYNIVNLNDDKSDVLYKCKVCGLLYVDRSIANRHVKLCFQTRQPKKKCQYCGLLFAINSINDHLRRHHGKFNFKAENFDIIDLRNPAVDDAELVQATQDEETAESKKINEKLTLQQLGKDGVVIGLVHKDTDNFNYKVDLSNYDNTLYKCTECDVCFMSARTLKDHVLVRNHKLTERTEVCNLCGFTFAGQTYVRHMNVHHKSLEIEAGAFIIKESFGNKANKRMSLEEQKKVNNVLYKCRECQIYFILEEFIYSHVKSFHLVLKTTKQCKICGLTFSTSSYARHNYLHHEKLNLKMEEMDIREYPFVNENGEEVALKDPKESTNQYNKETLRDIHLNRYTKKIYRCVKCDLNFMTKCALESHIYVQKHKFSSSYTKACSQCGLTFFVTSLKKHNDIHHEKMSLKLDDLVPITDLPPKNVSGKILEEDIEPKLYKCKDCNIHYVTQDRCYRHVAYGHEPIAKRYMTACGVCNLKFIRQSLRKHEQMHHGIKSYTLNEIVIEEYTPLDADDRINCVGPKIDVYIAADRLNKENDAQEVDMVENYEVDGNTEHVDIAAGLDDTAVSHDDLSEDTAENINNVESTTRNNDSVDENIKDTVLDDTVVSNDIDSATENDDEPGCNDDLLKDIVENIKHFDSRAGIDNTSDTNDNLSEKSVFDNTCVSNDDLYRKTVDKAVDSTVTAMTVSIDDLFKENVYENINKVDSKTGNDVKHVSNNNTADENIKKVDSTGLDAAIVSIDDISKNNVDENIDSTAVLDEIVENVNSTVNATPVLSDDLSKENVDENINIVHSKNGNDNEPVRNDNVSEGTSDENIKNIDSTAILDDTSVSNDDLSEDTVENIKNIGSTTGNDDFTKYNADTDLNQVLDATEKELSNESNATESLKEGKTVQAIEEKCDSSMKTTGNTTEIEQPIDLTSKSMNKDTEFTEPEIEKVPTNQQATVTQEVPT